MLASYELRIISYRLTYIFKLLLKDNLTRSFGLSVFVFMTLVSNLDEALVGSFLFNKDPLCMLASGAVIFLLAWLNTVQLERGTISIAQIEAYERSLPISRLAEVVGQLLASYAFNLVLIICLLLFAPSQIGQAQSLLSNAGVYLLVFPTAHLLGNRFVRRSRFRRSTLTAKPQGAFTSLLRMRFKLLWRFFTAKIASDVVGAILIIVVSTIVYLSHKDAYPLHVDKVLWFVGSLLAIRLTRYIKEFRLLDSQKGRYLLHLPVNRFFLPACDGLLVALHFLPVLIYMLCLTGNLKLSGFLAAGCLAYTLLRSLNERYGYAASYLLLGVQLFMLPAF